MNYDHQTAGNYIGSQTDSFSMPLSKDPLAGYQAGQIGYGSAPLPKDAFAGRRARMEPHDNASAKLGETPGAMDNLGRLIAELYAIDEKTASLASRIGGGGGESSGSDGTSTAAPATLATQTVILLSLATDISARLDRCLRNL